MVMYRAEIGALQWRHLARSASQLTSGMLSYQAMPRPHLGQWLPGKTMLSPRGSRHMTTFRKLPTHAPIANRNMKRMTSIYILPRPFICRPNRRMNPVASDGVYSSPMVKLASASEYRLLGDSMLAVRAVPL